ncbi:MAG TPA: PQQ-binding-like beta-propeller repeat protein, partial [Gemmatimonadaceae bacterium]|nr:PQQ-binding-like beta-propeller repeat protein [Gemmatimonadaceae bacterium]
MHLFVRPFVLAAAGVAGLLPLGAVAAQSSPASQFRGDAAHSGVYASAGPATFGGLQWRVQTDGPVRGSPTVSGSTVYVGSSDGTVYAIDVASGDVKWRRGVGSPVSSTPAVANGFVYVGGLDGVMHALRATDGSPAWTVRSGAPVRLQWGLESGETWTSSPAVAGDVVAFGARDGHVYAVDARSGRTRWRYDTGTRVYSSPAIAGGTVYVGAQDGHVHAIDLATGTRKWRFATEGTQLKSGDFGFDRTTVQSSPAIAGGLVYVGARDGWHYAIDANTGAERWRVDHKVSWVNTSPAVSDGLVFVGSSDGHFIQAVSATTGVEQWRTPSVN